jgi:F420-non-reducing hydrogenase iron-sulfur subunit
MSRAKEKTFTPKIIGFLCNWCSYAGADKAGTAQLEYPPNIQIIRVMCSGRVDPQFILKAYEQGADGVLLLACHPGDCHYKEGNYRAAQRSRMLQRLLRQFDIESDRFRLDYVSAGEGEKFARLVKEMVETITRLGPLSLSTQRKETHHGSNVV